MADKKKVVLSMSVINNGILCWCHENETNRKRIYQLNNVIAV